MFSSKKNLFILILLILIILAFALSMSVRGNTQTTPTVDANDIRTEAVATYLADQTRTALALPPSTFTPPPPPTDTPSSETATLAKPTDPCYKLLWLEDVTIPDNTRMAPGQSFTKTWKVQNNGGCAWAPGFKFSLVGGEAMGGQTLKINEPVSVGVVTELSIEMTAPADRTGTITGTWRMSGANGTYFGDALYVTIVLGGATTSTAAPSATAITTSTP
ncbi:MAG: NBR1-Ig-like domain-containing protein [Anaerolineales bacterium]|nr:NBR1-Ig-like domain-containing protein [Anaerolineales bacterium]